MKKLFCIFLACLCITPAFADDIDLSGMSYNELVRLKNKINIAMWISDEWQEVKVPSGLWKIGEDIPAGHWTLTASPEATYVQMRYGDTLTSLGKEVSYSGNIYTVTLWGVNSYAYNEGDLNSIDLELKDGYYLQIDSNYVTFTPYQGKPSFDFK